ncbi:MAG: tRNA lysidine(34) synthetase TilS [Ignavibacteriales bacterium]|nr:tRNA lysidine(34) synthetase TilS [Ignavibacteriales bacterium]
MKSFADTMVERFEAFVQAHSLIHAGEGVLLAVSGGIDSMVMLDIFRRISPRWGLVLTVAHLNHALRGEESDGDEWFVRATAGRLGVPFISERADVGAYQKSHGISKQEAARELRYAFFERTRVSAHAAVVATAHQADDNAETVLMNAVRGAGIRGLIGIPIRREGGSIIRPLLFARRTEIEQYAREQRIEFREDSSNRSLESTRNSIRHVILPSLNRDFHTDAIQSLNRISSLMRSLGEALDDALKEKLGDLVEEEGETTILRIPELKTQPLYLQEETAMYVFRRLGIEPSVAKVLSLLALCDQPTGHRLHLSGRWHALHDRDRLLVSPAHPGSAFEHEVQVGQEYSFPKFQFKSSRLDSVPRQFVSSHDDEVVDGDLLGSKLALRTWRNGDWFIPFGMKEKKKLSDFFVNEKIPLNEKRSTPILESDGTIVWVCGLRLDNRFRITEKTTSAVRLRYSPIPQ